MTEIDWRQQLATLPYGIVFDCNRPDVVVATPPTQDIPEGWKMLVREIVPKDVQVVWK